MCHFHVVGKGCIGERKLGGPDGVFSLVAHVLTMS